MRQRSGVARFPTTRRSVIAGVASSDAGERTRAFDVLTALYWKPLYKYARLASRCSREDAEDLTQSFLARMLESESLARFDPQKASFRTFLRTLFDRHAINEREAGARLKRGGGQERLDFDAAEVELAREPGRSATPVEIFEGEWARSVFTLAVERLRERCNPVRFAIFEAYDIDASVGSYRELASQFGLPETSITNHLAAARRDLRKIVLEILRDSAATDEEFRREVRSLLGVTHASR